MITENIGLDQIEQSLVRLQMNRDDVKITASLLPETVFSTFTSQIQKDGSRVQDILILIRSLMFAWR